jgi:hypothetical protein
MRNVRTLPTSAGLGIRAARQGSSVFVRCTESLKADQAESCVLTALCCWTQLSVSHDFRGCSVRDRCFGVIIHKAADAFYLLFCSTEEPLSRPSSPVNLRREETSRKVLASGTDNPGSWNQPSPTSMPPREFRLPQDDKIAGLVPGPDRV